MPHHHHPVFVALSLAIAIFGSWTALDLFRRVRSHIGHARLAWLGMAAVAMGVGIWSMHFIAMLGFDPGAPVAYDPALTVLSLALAIVATWGAFFSAARERAGGALIMVAGAAMGFGICAMHYVGMAALQTEARLRYETTGTTEVRLKLGASDGGMESPPFLVESRSEGSPDWCVGWIERTPRLEYDGPGGGLPARGAGVVWRAHVKNYGTVAADRVGYRWDLDGSPVGDGFVEGLQRFEETVVELRLPWDGQRHMLRVTVDPADNVAETSEKNNSRTVATDALLLGLWVERPLADRMHRVQASYADGANSVEDWAQRQVAVWNGLLAGAVHPLTPRGVSDRVALDRLEIVEEGELPLADGLPTNDPDARDRTLDLQRGLPASLLDTERWSGLASRAEDPMWIDRRLIRDLSRARCLADLSRLSVHRDEVLLDGPDGAPLAGSPYLSEGAGGFVHRSLREGLASSREATTYTEHEAAALQRIAGLRARDGNREPPPTQGEYLGDLPRAISIRVVDAHGNGVDDARVRAWRRTPDDDGFEAFSGEPVREGTTVKNGWVELSRDGVDPFFEGARGGRLDPARGVLLLEIERDGIPSYRFLEVVPYNLAYWRGERESHIEEVRVE